MKEAMKSIEKLKSRSGDDDDEDDDDDDDNKGQMARRCNGFSAYGSCYEITENEMDYENAKAHCKRQGGMLATWSDDRSVHRQLLDHAQEKGMSPNEYIWIGASYNAKNDRSTWADGRDVDIKVTRFTKQTACGAVFKRYIAGFKCNNEYKAWCQFVNDSEM